MRQWATVSSIILLMAACARPAENPEGSSLTVLYIGDERILAPYWDMPAKFLMFEPLFREAEGDRIEGRLAESWEMSPDGRSVRVTLRPNVTWHDGVPVTASDIAFTWNLWMDEAVGWVAPGGVEVEVLDARSVRLTANDPSLDLLGTWATYYPEHLLEGLDPAGFASWEFWVQPVGNGPYRYVRHVPKTMMEFAPYDDYYDGRAAIDRLVLKFGAGGPARVTELMSGEVDALGWATPAELRLLDDDTAFRAYHTFTTHYRAILWNARLPQFADARVRRALTHAIDRRALLEVLEMPPGAPLTDSLPDGQRLAVEDATVSLPHDPDRASQLLDEAGWIVTADGLRHREGQPLAFILDSADEDERAAVLIQEQLSRVGVDVELRIADRNSIRRRWRNADFEAILMNLSHDRIAPLFGADGLSGYANPTVAARIAAAETAASARQRRQILAEIEPLFIRDQPATILCPGVEFFIVPRWLEGLSSPYRADPLRYLDRLRVVRPDRRDIERNDDRSP